MELGGWKWWNLMDGTGWLEVVELDGWNWVGGSGGT